MMKLMVLVPKEGPVETLKVVDFKIMYFCYVQCVKLISTQGWMIGTFILQLFSVIQFFIKTYNLNLFREAAPEAPAISLT